MRITRGPFLSCSPVLFVLVRIRGRVLVARRAISRAAPSPERCRRSPCARSRRRQRCRVNGPARCRDRPLGTCERRRSLWTTYRLPPGSRPMVPGTNLAARPPFTRALQERRDRPSLWPFNSVGVRYLTPVAVVERLQIAGARHHSAPMRNFVRGFMARPPEVAQGDRGAFGYAPADGIQYNVRNAHRVV